jgi:hypothetical protein
MAPGGGHMGKHALGDGDNTGYILARDLDIRFFGWPVFLVTWLAFGLGSSRTEKSQEMKAMSLTRNELHRKLRVPIVIFLIGL